MKRIKAFFYVFYKSISSPSYYNDVVKANLGLSVKYYGTLAFVLALVGSGVVLYSFLPKVTGFIDSATTKVLDLYEDDLIVTASGGEVFINKPEPYIISFEDVFGDSDEAYLAGEEVQMPQNLIVFDSAGTIDDLTNVYDTLILVNNTNVIFQDEEGIRVESLSEVPDGTFEKKDLVELVSQVEGFAVYVPYILGGLIFVGLVFYFAILKLIAIFFMTISLWVIGRIRGLVYDFKTYFKILLHVITLPLLIETGINIAGVTLPLPFWFFVLTLILGVIVTFKLEAPVAPVEKA